MKNYFTFLSISLMLFCSTKVIATPCDSITTITCGTPIAFGTVSGLGDPSYPTTTVCGGTITQGGLEKIYKFIAPASGTYILILLSVANSNGVEYGYKIATICNSSGWNCLGILNAVGENNTVNLNTGDSIFILANARTINATSQTFQINCAIPFACTSITPITCGTPITFGTVSGLGDPNYPTTTVCGGTATQGGLEKIYKFIASSSGTYILRLISVASVYGVEYGYKTTAPCNWAGWNCLGILNAVGENGSVNLNAGDSIFILANARTINGTSQTFQIDCLANGIIDSQTEPPLFSLYPNPFSSQTILQSENILKDATLTVYNSFGQQVKQIKNIFGQTVTLFRDNLPSGIYFINLTQDSKIIATEKFVIID